ncbi:MAG: DUF3943 domain-containing protein [Gemmatimonadales bacterium]
MRPPRLSRPARLAAAMLVAAAPSSLLAQEAGPRAPEVTPASVASSSLPGDTSRATDFFPPGALSLSGRTGSVDAGATNRARLMTASGGTARLFQELLEESSEDPRAAAGSSAGGSSVAAASNAKDDGARYDVWGAKRNPGLAIGEVAGINAVVWFFNEYIREGGFTATNPSTWWFNISHGFFYDDNHFKTNMFAHPYHGSLYFNAARSNGLNYFESVPFAILGSFFWECCGETHLMAWNDWVMTSLGGATIGEILYRAGSTFLDNEKAGGSRTMKEIGNFFLNPMRGFNRLTSGRASRIYPNPASPYDRLTPFLRNFMKLGVRFTGDRTSNETFETDTTETHGFFEFEMTHGNVFRAARRKPFDYFTLNLQLNFKDTETLGRLQISGNLYTSDVAQSKRTHHVFGITQNYDYVNNSVVEFGGMSYGAALFSRFGISEKWDFFTEVNAHVYLLNAVNSEFAFIGGRPPNVERFREYDFGMGPGAWVKFGFTNKGRRVAGFVYRFTYNEVLNGSDANGGDTHHTIQWGGFQGVFPIGRWGVGADVLAYVRRSYYEAIGLQNIKQNVGQVRFYGVFQSF